MKLKVAGAIGFLLLVPIAMGIVACQSDEQMEFNRYYSAGSLIYQGHCQNCHGNRGEGLQGLIPPLTDQSYLKTNIVMLPCAVKYGMKGRLTILNRPFDGEMPQSDLASVEIAEAVTYITNSFGNKMGTTTSQQVEERLGRCK